MKKKRIAPFPLRLPDDLRRWVQEMANKNERSLNSEIRMVLKKYRIRAERKLEETPILKT